MRGNGPVLATKLGRFDPTSADSVNDGGDQAETVAQIDFELVQHSGTIEYDGQS